MKKVKELEFDKDDKFRRKMIEVFKEKINDLEKIIPNFKIANDTIQFDEYSLHLHIVDVPFKDGIKIVDNSKALWKKVYRIFIKQILRYYSK